MSAFIRHVVQAVVIIWMLNPLVIIAWCFYVTRPPEWGQEREWP